ncbi:MULTISPECIES: abortive infection family protein [unclassified Luteibacter]|uniref:abortive infection family protein n=1 Tax=Luteibacter sp. PvP019 TaxID=3156436 RepID=UPI003398C4E7
MQPRLLDGLTGKALTAALRTYADRARRGALDNPLLTGTAKDLLEATAGHVIEQKFGRPPQVTNFPTLLAQAFMAIDLAIPDGPPTNGKPELQRTERAAYELACAINGLRNKQGTGHGRPWLSVVTDA